LPIIKYRFVDFVLIFVANVKVYAKKNSIFIIGYIAESEKLIKECR